MADALLEALTGSWKQTGLEFKMSDNGEIIRKDFRGFCNFDANGRWTVVTMPMDSTKPETDQERIELYNWLVAFSSRCRVEADGIVAAIDVAWNPAFLGAEIYRGVSLDGDRLTRRHTCGTRERNSSRLR